MDCPIKQLVRTGKYYCEYYGISTDTKPTTGLVTGSFFVEQDTKKVYSWNDELSTWYLLCDLGGGS